jgi:hypothetical protein
MLVHIAISQFSVSAMKSLPLLDLHFLTTVILEYYPSFLKFQYATWLSEIMHRFSNAIKQFFIDFFGF